jgi:ATP-dependent Lon protease
MLDETNNDKEGVEIISGHTLARSNEVLPTLVQLLPVSSRPFFPGQVVPLLMDQEYWESTIEAAVESSHQLLGVVLSDADEAESAAPDSFKSIGTVSRIHRVQKFEGRLQVLVECVQRFRIEKIANRKRPFTARIEYLPEPASTSKEIKPYAVAIINTIKELLPLNPLYAEELRVFLDRFGPDDPSHLTDFAASLTTSDRFQLQAVLETVDLLPRMEKVLELLHRELEVVKAQASIRKTVEQRMEKQQREFLLREQLKAIQQELGIEKDDRTAELDKFRQRLEQLTLTEQARARVEEEMDKLSVLETGSPEY